MNTLNYETAVSRSPVRAGREVDGTRVGHGRNFAIAGTDAEMQTGTAIEQNTSDSDASDAQIVTTSYDSGLDQDGLTSESPNQQVLEYFFGKVEQVNDGIAFVSLTSTSGEKLMGQYSAKELEKKDIRDGDWFDCETVLEAEKVSVRITKRKRIPLSDQMLRRMDEELDIDFAGLE